ncbi:sensor domain-containing diguanylate cyclase [Kineosporia succinea]|uniref:Diguanylate cyclase (GGDEF)-like protein n=1 Tax=Kineosporia succinea TaxID=84632 RepID=A0ABT9NW29_9ACTN|nr:diguanylate cyclase [Kineosporia succinea]MDP9824354.1 diguanylate cyclase (GGDEF)-like protein [Kineosporia succinea]
MAGHVVGDDIGDVSYGAYTDVDRQEQARIEAVHALGLIERPVAEGIDRLVELAAELCRTENATINIVDEEWLHSIAAVGGPKGSFPREDIPCDLVVRSGQELVVENATTVPILANSPVVDGTIARMGFYASVPLRTLTGHVVGTLCAYDEQERTFTAEQLKMLRILADHAIGIFQMADALERARHATEQLARRSRQAQESQQGRRSAEELLGAVFRHAADGIVVVAVSGTETGRIVHANPAAQTLTGRSGLVGLTLEDVVAGQVPVALGAGVADDGTAARRALLEDLDRLVTQPAGTFPNDTVQHRTRMSIGTGHLLVNLVITLTRDAEGSPEHALVQMRDVTAQQVHEQWLERQARTDPLTGLGNRTALRERLRAAIGSLPVTTGDTGLGVVMIDLDELRAVNDARGQGAGDDLIRRTARALADVVPDGSFTARLGGDEFVVLTGEATEESVREESGRVQRALAEVANRFGADTGLTVTTALGVMFTQDPAIDPDELLRATAATLAENKRRRGSAAATARIPGQRVPAEPPALYAVPSLAGSQPLAYPAPTPAPRHAPQPGDVAHPAQSRRH